MDPRILECSHFFLSGTFTAADDGSGMTHPASGRRSLSGDKCHYRFLAVLLYPSCRLLLGISAYFADEYDTFGIGIGIKQFHDIEEWTADNWIAADSNAGALSKSRLGKLVYRFVG